MPSFATTLAAPLLAPSMSGQLSGTALSPQAPWPPPPGDAPTFTFAQSWRDHPEVGFQADRVHIAALTHDLLIWADLQAPVRDHAATCDHTWLWEQGDVFEVFLQAAGEPGYTEYQLAPNGHILQLAYPKRWDRRGDLSSMIHRQPRLRSRIALQPSGWRIFAIVPLPEGTAFSSPQYGRWRVSFGRYHYRLDGHAVISSTSPHPEPDFHRPQEWTEFTLS